MAKSILNEQIDNYRKRFNAILEYTQVNGMLNEAEPEDPMAGGAPDAGMGGDPMAGGAPDASMGGDPMPGDVLVGEGPIPGDDAVEDDDIETMEDDDEVIDVDELTGYQEKTAKGVGKISDELKDLKKLITSFEDKVNANNQGIEDLKRELQKRAPDAEERITLRKAKSGPFTQNVEDYWDNSAPENYRVSTEDKIDTPKYVITKSDIDGISDWNSISKSFDEMAELNDLRNIFGI